MECAVEKGGGGGAEVGCAGEKGMAVVECVVGRQ